MSDRHSEASTHGNLAVAYQALGMFEQALQHYNAHLNIARDLKDIASEARALSNVGNYYSVRGEFTQAIPFYMQYLQVSVKHFYSLSILYRIKTETEYQYQLHRKY